MKRRKKKYKGEARALMILCRDIRRRWSQYGENRGRSKDNCIQCKNWGKVQWDHIKPIGSRPLKIGQVPVYWKKMFKTKCQALCLLCHKAKTETERRIREVKRAGGE